MRASTCAACGARLIVKSGPGRPARFCGSGCRRDAESERKRLEQLLEQLASEEAATRRQIAAYAGLDDEMFGHFVDQLRTDAAELRTQIGPIRSRLRVLFAAGDHVVRA